MRRMNRAMSDMLDNPSVRKRLEGLGLEIVPSERRSPEYLAAFLLEEIERRGKVIRAAQHQRGLRRRRKTGPNSLKPLGATAVCPR